MKEHPEIERLINPAIDAEVEAHLLTCAVCQQIANDVQLFAINLEDLKQPFALSKVKNEQIIQDISKRSIEIRRSFFRHKNFSKAMAAIAAALVIGGLWFFSQTSDSETITAKVLTNDFNRDGQVNVIDSFLLAKSLNDDSTPTQNFDLNKDGQTNNEDLLILRKSIVSLGDDQ